MRRVLLMVGVVALALSSSAAMAGHHTHHGHHGHGGYRGGYVANYGGGYGPSCNHGGYGSYYRAPAYGAYYRAPVYVAPLQPDRVPSWNDQAVRLQLGVRTQRNDSWRYHHGQPFSFEVARHFADQAGEGDRRIGAGPAADEARAELGLRRPHGAGVWESDEKVDTGVADHEDVCRHRRHTAARAAATNRATRERSLRNPPVGS